MKPENHTVPIVTLLMSALALPAASAPDRIDLLGTPAPPAAASQEIRIKPDTKYVNVEGGDAVRFVVGDKAFGWVFDGGRNTGSFDLKDVAPSGILDHPVTVYIAPDPRWVGNT
jgi:hypothetical protein